MGWGGGVAHKKKRGENLYLRDPMKNLRSSECFIDNTRLKDTRKPPGKHFRFLKEAFNSIDFYCSENSVKTWTGLLNGFRHMHLHTERKKPFQFLDLIHQTKCALNFNKLLNYKPQQHSCVGL